MLHEALRDPALACGTVDEKLRDLAAVRLIGRQREDHLNRPDQPAFGKRTEKQPAAVLDLGGHRRECRSRFLVCERGQIADRCASRDAVDENGSERIELRVRRGCIKTSDLDLLGHTCSLRRKGRS
jgi:hypothetical protein